MIFTDWYYPAYKAGGPVTSVQNLVRLLASHYQCFVVCGDRDLGDTSAYENIALNTWQNGNLGEQILYLSNAHCTVKTYKAIAECCQPNYVYYNSLYSVNFTLKPVFQFRKLGLNSFISPRGMLHPAAFAIKSKKKKLFLGLFKVLPMFRKLHFLVSDEIEKQYVLAHGLRNKVSIVPNIPDIGLLERNINTTAKPSNIITVSRIAPEKNSLLALQAISEIKEDVVYTWIGDSKDSTYLKAFLDKVNELPKNIEFNYLGALPKPKITEKLLENGVFFLPTLGENFGHAIYEALALGLPSVISNKTPFNFIAQNKAGFVHEPNAYKLFSSSILKLVQMDSQAFAAYQLNAKASARQCFAMENALGIYQNIWG